MLRRVAYGVGIAVMGAGLLAQSRPAELSAIVKGLASNEFAVRDAAQRELDKVPAQAIEALQHEAQTQTDPEIRARLAARIPQMAVELLRQPNGTAQTSYPLPVQVVDKNGKPIPGAIVSTTPFHFGPRIDGVTDGDGRVTLPVPVTGLPLPVRVDADGFSAGNATVQPGEAAAKPAAAAEGEVVLQPQEIAKDTISGVVVDNRNQPVAHQMLKLMGTYELDKAVTTGAGGEFSLTVRHDGLSYAVPWIQVGDQAAPLDVIKDVKVPLAIRLAPLSTITGKITERDTGKGIGGARLSIHPKASIPRVKFTGTTQPDGTYKMTVPGGEYFVDVEDPAYFDPAPRGFSFERKTVFVTSGQTATADLALHKAAIIMGQVVDSDGKPVPGAIVSLPSSVNGDYREQNRGMQTGTDGKFIVGTAHVTKSDLSLSVTSLLHGKLDTRLPPLAEGDLHTMVITLPGSVRLQGTVADTAGKPIQNVVCRIQYTYDSVQTLSKADGTFDFGQVTLIPGERQPSVSFHAPRPRRAGLPPEKMDILRPNGQPGEIIILDYLSAVGASDGDFFVDVPSREQAPPFYAHGSAEIKATAKAGALNLKVTLPPAHLLELTGVVKDGKGEVVPHAEVYLLRADATADKWVKSARQTKAGELHITNSMGPPDWRLAETRSDAQGRWHIFVVREDLPGATLGCYANGNSTFVARVPLLVDGDIVELPMTLGQDQLRTP